VQSVLSVGGVGRLGPSPPSNEGSPRWEALPRSESGPVGRLPAPFDPNLGFNNESCRAIQVLIFTKNHDGPTVAHVVDEVKKFHRRQPGGTAFKLRLASGKTSA